jgi:hypothetical protein
MISNSSGLSLLLIAFQRASSIRDILEVSIRARIQNVYVVVDSPLVSKNQHSQKEVYLILDQYKDRFETFKVFQRSHNVGCAISVLTGLDWIFNHEDYVCILEDDCVPTLDFFQFVLDSKIHLENDPDLLLACGTQFAPENMTQGSWVKSSYSLTWGWATTKKNWIEIRNGFIHQQLLFDKFSIRQTFSMLFSLNRKYWSTGSRRAIEGYVDVWDTVLVNILLTENKYAILPSVSLVVNVGSDAFATHTKTSKWTNLHVGNYFPSKDSPKINQEVELWLRRHFFRIRLRHFVTNRFSTIRDFFFTPPRSPLIERWQKNQIIDS